MLEEKQENVRAIDLANFMSFSKASVSVALKKLKSYGKKILIITLFQSLLATICVDAVVIVICLILKVNIAVAIVLGAIATATAPAATIMVIQQYKAKGELVDILLPVVAFDDAVGLVVFSISVSIAKLFMSNDKIDVGAVIAIPLLNIMISLALGLVLGIIMHFLIKFFKSRNNHAITIIAFTLLGVGACNMLSSISILGEKLEISNLLCCMMIGAVYVNYSKPEDQAIINRDIDFMDHWTSFLFMLFFVLSGANLSLKLDDVVTNNSITSLIPIFIIFLGYIIMRSFGKCFGAYLGCKITKQSENVTKYLGATLLPQAGVAIGMANQISANKTIDASVGNTIVIVVLIATLVYELFGPLITKWALTKAGDIEKTEDIEKVEKSGT